MYSLIIIISLLSSFTIMATTFDPSVTIKQQIKDSQAIVHGEVIYLEAEEMDGQIVTRVDLDLERWVEAKVDNNQVSVYYPGGSLKGKATKVQGAPNLELGEKVVLMLIEVDGKLWVNKLGLGKFSVKRVGTKEIIVNQIFPERPGVGQMGLDKFVSLTEWVKKKSFNNRFRDKYEINMDKTVKSNSKNNNRSLASTNNDHNKESHDGVPHYWLVILLGAIAFVFKITRNRTT